MLTREQRLYLDRLPNEIAERPVLIRPFDPGSKELANKIIQEIKELVPSAEVYFLGSAALELPGLNDIDISAVDVTNFSKSEKKLLRKFGKTTDCKEGRYSYWEFYREGFKVEISLNNDYAPQIGDQIKVHEAIRKSPSFRHEYKILKEKMNGRKMIDYKRSKFEFFNKVLIKN